MTQTDAQHEMIEKAPDKYSLRIAKYDTMKTLSAFNVVANRGVDANNKIMWDMSDEALQEKLSDFDVDEVKRVLNMILDDSSVKKNVRRNAVSRITQNQPHPVNNFLEFRKHDQDARRAVFYNEEIQDRKNATAICFLFSVLLLLISIIGFFATEETGKIPLALHIGFISASIACGVFGFISLSQGKQRINQVYSEIYGDREHLSLDEMREKQKTKELENTKKIYEECQVTLKRLESSESMPVTPSLESVKEDYKQAIARIAGYETDLEKALRYPAFNDISVPDVQKMVKQMRICRNRLESLDHSSINEFSDQVSELWVRIHAAEETAKRIALGDLNESEIKDIEIAKNLLSHASDASAYSEEVRAGFYEKLRAVVNRLNTRRTVVNSVSVAEIEKRGMKLIEKGNEQ